MCVLTFVNFHELEIFVKIGSATNFFLSEMGSCMLIHLRLLLSTYIHLFCREFVL